MLTHTWVEQYRDFPAGTELAQGVRSAVQFDFGDSDDMPIAAGVEFCEARAPFDNCLLQFSTPSAATHSHILIWWRVQPDSSIHMMAAWRLVGTKRWNTTYPREITRSSSGSFRYEGFGDDQSQRAFEKAHAIAMNAFYILGCSNVKTVDNPAPDALNKKRCRSGKFPILTHKTLVVVTDATKFNRVNQGGTHSSPRVHLRRGHVRKLSDAKRVWVQACVVGSKHGVVTKDYAIRTSPMLEVA